MTKKGLLFLLVIFSLSQNVVSRDKSGIEISGDILEYAMPSAAFVSTFIWDADDKPHWQFAKSFGMAVGTAVILKQVVKKPRPDNTATRLRYDSFPSGHTTSAFVSAAFLERRYGWKVGVPAYLAAGWVGYSRVYAERHDWYDVLGGSVIGTASSYLFTKVYKKKNLDISFNVAPETCQLSFTCRF